MRPLRALALALASPVLFACGGSESSPPAPPPPPPVASVASVPPSAQAAPAPSAAAAPPEPTAEEKKKAEDAKRLADEKAKWEDARKAETARWTPEMHAAAKALAEKKYPDLKAALKAVLAGPQRAPADIERDKYRHPEKTLEFFGIQPTMTVLEVGPGEGWYTKILAPTLAARGKLLVTITNPDGPADSFDAFLGQRFKSFLDFAPELYGKTQTVVVDPKDPKLDGVAPASLDAVVVMRELHGMVNQGTLDKWLAEIHGKLKPGGILGIEEHRAPVGADPQASSKRGYVPEKWAVAQIEAASFKLAGSSELNANPKDTKDYEDGVWDLPPVLRKGDTDREKYLAIGESDRMTLKFKAVAAASAAKK